MQNTQIIQRVIESKIVEALGHVDRIRSFWSMDKDPGPGEYKLPEGYLLRILENEEIKKGKKNTVRTYIVATSEDKRDPISMASDWERFSGNLRRRDGEEFSMSNLSIHDNDLRDKIKLKCKNDWNYDLSDDQISMCIIEMEEQRLSIFHNQIWPNSRNWKDKQTGSWRNRITWDKAIDGYRAIAHRSGRFAGVDAAVFDLDENNQLIARITVYALDSTGNPRPYVGEARFDEFVQLVDEYSEERKTGKRVPNNQWSESPRNQLAIAAERQALRKAFQDLMDDPKPFVYESEPALEQPSRAQAPEPDPEGSRGIPTAPEVSKSDQASKRRTSKAENGEKGDAANSDNPERDQQKYVGVPKGGFKEYKKYNNIERIIMMRKKGDVYHLALDSGNRVTVDAEGYEIDRSDRSDKTNGGRKWENGDSYFDGSMVEAIAASKRDDSSLWLALNNGFKVLLDQWGKELERKERKKGKSKTSTKAEPVASAPKGASDVTADAKISKSTTTTKGRETAVKGDASESEGKTDDKIDPESVDTIEMMRKITGPLLKEWFKIIGRSLSPKDAYKEFTGVILSKGQAMSLDDYKVLYDCLEEAINDHRTS